MPQGAVVTYHPVTGDDDRDRILSHGRTYGARRARTAGRPGQLPIGDGGPGGDVQEGPVDGGAEGREPERIQSDVLIVPSATEAAEVVAQFAGPAQRLVRRPVAAGGRDTCRVAGAVPVAEGRRLGDRRPTSTRGSSTSTRRPASATTVPRPQGVSNVASLLISSTSLPVSLPVLVYEGVDRTGHLPGKSGHRFQLLPARREKRSGEPKWLRMARFLFSPTPGRPSRNESWPGPRAGRGGTRRRSDEPRPAARAEQKAGSSGARAGERGGRARTPPPPVLAREITGTTSSRPASSSASSAAAN